MTVTTQVLEILFTGTFELWAWAEIHQALLSQFSLLVEYLIEKVPVKD